MVKILRRALESVVAHARESLPRECCGILLAVSHDLPTVSHALRAANAAENLREQRFSLGHIAHVEAVAMEASGTVRIVGYYHSHPNGVTQPSAHDLKQAIGGITYLIIGIRNGSVQQAAWRLADDQFVRQPLEVIE